MTYLKACIAPDYRYEPSSYADLDFWARTTDVGHLDFPAEALQDKRFSSNPYRVPVVADALVRYVHKTLGVTWSYGGMWELRSTLWKNTYMRKTGIFMHVGVDVNLPVGAKIALCRGGEIVLAEKGKPEPLGWGGRIIVRSRESDGKYMYMVYAHCDFDLNLCKIESYLHEGTVVGAVDDPTWTGGYPHCHVQMLSEEAYDRFFVRQVEEFDGYVHPSRIEDFARWCPDPIGSGYLTLS